MHLAKSNGTWEGWGGHTARPPPHLGRLRRTSRQSQSFWEQQRGIPSGVPGRSTGFGMRPAGSTAGACEDDSGHAAHEAVSTPVTRGGASPVSPSPSGENAAAMPSSARSCSSSPGSWLGPEGESMACQAHPDPASLLSPWDPEHRADLPGHHPGSNAASGSPHGSTRQGESTAPPGSSLPCPLGGHKHQVLIWMPFVWLGVPCDSFKTFSPSLPCAMCMQQIFHPPPSPGGMNSVSATGFIIPSPRGRGSSGSHCRGRKGGGHKCQGHFIC